MYKIIGGDGQEYGPVTESDLSKWITEGRLNAQSLAKAEGEAGFRPLSTFPEFASTLGTAASAHSTPPPRQAVDWRNRDYELDIGGCISRGWTLVMNNLGILLGSAVLCLVLIVIANFVLVGITSVIGNTLSIETRVSPAFQIIQNFVLNIMLSLVFGPLFGGLYSVIIQTIRGQPPGVGHLFIGFQARFSQLFLGFVVMAFANSACILPASIVYTSRLAPVLAISEQAKHGTITTEQTQQMFHQMFSALTSAIPIFLICLVPLCYLYTNFLFVIPLIVDKGMDFWTAIKTSWRMVHKHWFTVFGLVFLTGLINVAGLCLCCLPGFFTFTIVIVACMFAYETIFGESRSV